MGSRAAVSCGVEVVDVVDLVEERNDDGELGNLGNHGTGEYTRCPWLSPPGDDEPDPVREDDDHGTDPQRSGEPRTRVELQRLTSTKKQEVAKTPQQQH